MEASGCQAPAESTPSMGHAHPIPSTCWLPTSLGRFYFMFCWGDLHLPVGHAALFLGFISWGGSGERFVCGAAGSWRGHVLPFVLGLNAWGWGEHPHIPAPKRCTCCCWLCAGCWGLLLQSGGALQILTALLGRPWFFFSRHSVMLAAIPGIPGHSACLPLVSVSS